MDNSTIKKELKDCTILIIDDIEGITITSSSTNEKLDITLMYTLANNVSIYSSNRSEQTQLKSSNAYITFGDIKLSSKECRVLLKDIEIKLSLKEFCLLETLMTSPYRVWTRAELLNRCWGMDFYGSDRTVDTHITWLRKKLNINARTSPYLKTIRGIGYRFI